MSTTPEATQETPPQEQDKEQSTAESPEKQTQGTETEDAEPESGATEQANTEKEKQETTEETTAINDDKAKSTTILANETSMNQSTSKRKLDPLPAASDEREKTKKARTLKTNTKKTPDAAKRSLKSDFSFARPTASSARRAAAITEKKTQAKPEPPSRKSLVAKHPSTKTHRVTTPVSKPTAASTGDKGSRSHFSYTPYTGPLPPLTVESSFAPKGGQSSDRPLKSASPAVANKGGSARKSRPPNTDKTQEQRTIGKENAAINAKETTATNIACDIRTPDESGKTNSEQGKKSITNS